MEDTGQYRSFDIGRRIVAYKTSASWKEIPHVSYIYEPDITDFYDEYEKLSKSKTDIKISVNTIMMKVITEGLLAAPELNAHIEYHYRMARGKIHNCRDINLSIPWSTPDGRTIPLTVPKADRLSLYDMAVYVEDLAKRVKKSNMDEILLRTVAVEAISNLKKMRLAVLLRLIANLLGKEKVRGLQGAGRKAYYEIPEHERLTEKDILHGTVTVSNVGSLYKGQRGFFALLEIVPPQIFAVGLGRVQEKPGVYTDLNGDKHIGIRKTIPMCLAFDHRAVDFNSLIPFLKRLDDIFANPNIIHNW